LSGTDGWLDRLKQKMAMRCPVFVCQNKIDLPHGVNIEDVNQLLELHHAIIFLASAATRKETNEFDAIQTTF
jgi:signal recognition particle receptor subunit beta